MAYLKTIICLANSRKLTGRCVAGKEWDGVKAGPWCRPVSARQRGELSAERWYAKSWRDPQLLDLIEVSLIGHYPSGCQTENYLVDAAIKWKLKGHVSPMCLIPFLDHPDRALWVNGESTTGGVNDRVQASIAEKQTNSLVLVQPDKLVINVKTEAPNTERARRRVRGHFMLAGQEYGLSITDPVVEEPILRHPDGFSTVLQKPILCISLSEKFRSQNACYKLIAGVIRTC